MCYKPSGYCTNKNINIVLRELGLKSRLIERNGCWPRTGMHCVITCIKSGCVPYLYGFEYKKRRVIMHYSKGRRYDVKKMRIHDVDGEVEVLNELEKKGLIVIKKYPSRV